MKNWLRVLALVLVLVMTAAVFAACGSTNPGPDKEKDKETSKTSESGEKQTDAETQQTGPKTALDEFLDDFKSDYKDREFKVAVFPDDASMIWRDVDWLAEDYTGDTINDAVYVRNKTVEDILGITISAVPQSDYADAGIQEITNGISSGNKTYDALNISCKNAFSAAQGEYLRELHEFGEITLNAPWWDANVLKDMSIGGQNYILTGDINTMYKKSIAVIMFNKRIIQDIDLTGIGTPYQLRDSKEWTIENMVELGSLFSNDVDSNDKYDEHDQYGLIYFCNMAATAMIGAGTQFVTKDEDDIPELTFYSEDTVDILDELATLLYDQSLAWSWSAAGLHEDTAFTMFKADQSLFYYGELHAVAEMRAMDSPFGIMPMPLLDDAQDQYHHSINPDVAAVIAIPADVEDDKFTGEVLDCIAAASRDILTPAYYEQNLQGKVSRDEESRETLDIVITTINYDIGYLSIPDIAQMLNGMANSRSKDLASKYMAAESTIQAALDDIVEKFS